MASKIFIKSNNLNNNNNSFSGRDAPTNEDLFNITDQTMENILNELHAECSYNTPVSVDHKSIIDTISCHESYLM